jgi:SPX domain protein involved in polyphosphate accumulation
MQKDSHNPVINAGVAKNTDSWVDKVISRRYELKYRICESKAEAIRQFIKPYMQLDRYCKLRRSGTYPIVSLYLDSDNLQLCKESLTGQKNRFKLRIRSYTDELDYPRFFEIKRRINNVIVKSRARVMDRDILALLEGVSLTQQDYNYSTDLDALKQFQLYVNSIGARPVIQIRYMRQAYEGDSENRVRVTFDRQLNYKVTNVPQVRLNGREWQRRLLSGVILEIKFTNRYPAWLNRMVEYFDLPQQSMSKYATSIKEACSFGFCAPRFME